MSFEKARVPGLFRWALVFVLALAACLDTRPWRAQPPPWTDRCIADAEEVRVLRADGSWFHLTRARIEADGRGGSIRGSAVSTPEEPVRAIDVPLAEVQRLETRQHETARAVGNVVIGAVLVLLILSAIVVTLISIEVSAAAG